MTVDTYNTASINTPVSNHDRALAGRETTRDSRTDAGVRRVRTSGVASRNRRDREVSVTVSIANAAGFWGDDEEAPRRTLDNATDLDYLTMDYLAEVTMAVLVRQQERDPDRGYATDFPPLMEDVLADAIEQGVTILANAGGVNPDACRDAVLEVAREQGLDASVATVSGDDFRDRIEAFDAGTLRHAYTNDPLPADADVVSANAYLGGFPVAQALDSGADVIVTGRVIDAALITGPLIHEHGWDRADYDRLARGLMAGHVIECGAQATGGNFLGDWHDVDFEHIGFPIAEVEADGATTITKPPNTGGMVTPARRIPIRRACTTATATRSGEAPSTPTPTPSARQTAPQRSSARRPTNVVSSTTVFTPRNSASTRSTTASQRVSPRRSRPASLSRPQVRATATSSANSSRTSASAARPR
ncbi:hypothetical protein BRC68_07475 [Halobacteriales archaeon QH_6_64_20]|nr:MAG: hypothetical protein BRC68_07475 [Halobacteriales archaeon QH_6_64_20]